ncbi:MAG: aminotransferase class V-fold PLP-dependent enzyme [Longimicrobiales bacterium]
MDWTAWRAEFPILARATYLNSCSLGALSLRAQASLSTFQEDWHAQGASAWYETWIGRLAELRGRVAALLGAAEPELALAPSTSVALAAVASALDYRRRPKVVLAELDFPTMAYVWRARPEVEVVLVPSDDDATIDLARWADTIDGRTAAVVTSHVFYTTGAIQDLRAIAELAHAKGALLVADAYQSAGQVPIDVAELGVDALTAGPLKWLLGGPGLAYLYVRGVLADRLRPTIAGWFGTRDQFAFDITRFEPLPGARRFEMGTPALPTVHTALGGQSIIDEIGVPRIRERNRALTERLVAGALDAGLKVRTAPAPDARSAIVMIADVDPDAAVARLARQGMIVDARPGFVRVSPHFYNTEDEVDAVVAALAER